MSILTMEYDVEIAKRVYGEEQREERTIEIARNMIVDGDSSEKIMRCTGLPHEEVERLRANIL